MAYLGRPGATAPLTTADIPDSSITAAKIATGAITAADVAADMATQAELDAKLSLAGGEMTGAITTNSTFDGVDIATRDAILTSTTTTAGAALPKAGGTMTGKLTVQESTTDHYQIHCDQNGAGHSAIRFDADGTNFLIGTHNDTANTFRITNGSAFGSNDHLTILSTGEVGIGTTSPSNLLTLKADGTTVGNKILKFESNGGGNNDAWIIKNVDDAKFYVENVGQANGAYLTYNSTSGWTSYSDRRWKTDWTPISGSLEKLNKLEVAKFHNLKGESPDNLTKTEPKDGDNEKWNIGISAQDCTSAGLGDIVDNPSDGANGIDETKRKGVSYNELTAVCIQAIQELSAKVTALESA